MTTNEHPTPASPLPWKAVQFAEVSDASGRLVFTGHAWRDVDFAAWAANNAPSLAAEVARLRAALEEAAADAHKVALITDKNARIVGALAVAVRVRAALEAK